MVLTACHITACAIYDCACHAVGDRYKDEAGGYCNTKPFQSCLIAYYRWFKKIKGHLRKEETSFFTIEEAFVTLEVSPLSSAAYESSRLNTQFSSQTAVTAL